VHGREQQGDDAGAGTVTSLVVVTADGCDPEQHADRDETGLFEYEHL
jgi:hypothetical protein